MKQLSVIPPVDTNKTGETQEIKILTDEDMNTLSNVVNPYPKMVEDILTAIEATEDVEKRIKLIEQLMLVVCNTSAVQNPKVQSNFRRMIDLLKVTELYDSAAIMLSDACRHLNDIQNIFRELGIFDLLIFSNERHRATSALVFSICFENKNTTDYFIENYYDESRDRKNSLIVDVLEQKFENI